MTAADGDHRGMRPGQHESMAQVVVRYWAGAAHAAGVDEERLGPAATVGEALGEAARLHPALETVLPACSVLVDGLVVPPDAPVAETTVIEVLPPFAGG